MTAYRCWLEDDRPQVGQIVPARSAVEAAERYARWHDAQAVEFLLERVVRVKNASVEDGATVTVVVTLRAEPVYEGKVRP